MTDSPESLHPLYALSDPITVPVPERATFALIGWALILVGVYRILRGLTVTTAI
jgi:hypothetical protein